MAEQKNMKRKFALIIFLFNRYYSKGATKSIAYESAIMATSFLIFMNFMAVSIILSIDDVIYSFIYNENGVIKLMKGSILLLPQIILLAFCFKKKYINELKYDNSKINLWNMILLAYFIFSFLMVGALVLFYKVL
jgi:hypothetical protein